jgi:uncharacterized protein (DUF427 family)
MKSIPELKITLGKTLEQIKELQDKFSWKEEKSYYYEREMSSLYKQADVLANRIIIEEKKRGKVLYEKKKEHRQYLNRKILQQRFAAKTLSRI